MAEPRVKRGLRWPRWAGVAVVAGLSLFACSSPADCVRCDTIVIAATGEPGLLNPALASRSAERDVGDFIYERLAILEPGKSPIDESAYRPGLARSWRRADSLTWRFSLRPGATWHDGRPVRAADVAFSFGVFQDSILDPAARATLTGVTATADGDSVVSIRFPHPSPEQLYDATYHVRILPEHVWAGVPRAEWATDTATARLVGSGAYRFGRWERGTSLGLDAADPNAAGIRRIVWRFAADQDAALNLVLSHEADLIETVPNPAQLERARTDPSLRAERYPSAVYGFLGFRLDGRPGKPLAPGLGSLPVRRALAQAIDRRALAQNVFGPDVKVPAGPMSAMLWIWDDGIQAPGFDLTAANQALDQAGWIRESGQGMRRRGAERLAVDLLVPATSRARNQLAVAIQEMWRQAGVATNVVAVDFPVFQERLGKGQFDAYIGAWLDEPSPRGLADQWSRAGWAALNYGHYANPRFDSLFTRATAVTDPTAARTAWKEALDTLNADVPAIFLYTPVNVAVVNQRVEHLAIDPYSWLRRLPEWRLRRP